MALGLALARASSAQIITEYPVPTPDADLGGICSGPDGALWFTESAARKIGRIATDGTVTEFPLPTGAPPPYDIVAGPDGNLWFTETDLLNDSRIGRMTTSGTVTEFPLPADHVPGGIVAGSDGNLWFEEGTHLADFLFGAVGRITTSGVFEDFLLNPGGVRDTAVGPDGNVWFVQPQYTHLQPWGPYIGQVTTSGVVTTLPMLLFTTSIAAGPDGNIWVSSYFPRSIQRVTTPGSLTATFPVSEEAHALAAGPDGALWFLDAANRVGRISMDGGLAYYAVPTANSGPRELTAGPDGAMWFTETTANQIGRLALPATTPTPLPPLPTFTPTPSPTPQGPGPGAARVPAMSVFSVAALILGLAAAGLWLSRSR